MRIPAGTRLSRVAAALLVVASYSVTTQLAETIRRMERFTGRFQGSNALPEWSPEAVAFVVWAGVTLALIYAFFEMRESAPRIYGVVVIAGTAAIGGVIGLKVLGQGMSVDQSLALLGSAVGAVDGVGALRRPRS